MKQMIDPNSISKVLADAIVKKPNEQDEKGYKRQIIQGNPSTDKESRIVFQTHPNFSYGACLGVLADKNASYPTIVVGKTKTNELGIGNYSYGDVLEIMPSGFRKYDDSYSWNIELPARNNNYAHYLLSNHNVKTIFGQKIYSKDGTGKIDLYAHDITITKGTGKAFLTVYSSKNTNIDSLDDLKTIAGATFTKSCTGYINSKVIVAITETAFLLADGTTEALTGATFVDNPTTI